MAVHHGVVSGGRGLLVRRRGATLAVHLPAVTVQIVLLLPDRQAMLDLIDDVAAGAERLIPVRRAHPDPHGELADGEHANAMHAGGVRHTEARDGLGDDALALAHA